MVRPSMLLPLALVAALASPVHAAPRAPQLAASTTFVAASSGYLDVYLPREVRLSPKLHGNPDVTISGKGRMISASLTTTSNDANAYGGVSITRMPGFAGAETEVYGSTTPAYECKYVHPLLPPTECNQPTPTAIVLPHGAYRLTVLTDGSPVTVTFKLRGLSARRTSLRPSRSLFTAEVDLPQLETAGDKLVTYGGATKVPANRQYELTLVARATFAATNHVYESSGCVRRDTAATPAFGYAPPCAGGDEMSLMWTADANGVPYYGGLVFYGMPAVPGSTAPLGIGGSFGDTGGVKFHGGLAVVMESTYTY